MEHPSPVDNANTQALLNKIIIEYFADKKRKRFWRWTIRIIIAAFLMFISYSLLFMGHNDLIVRNNPHIGLIDIKGEIVDNHSGSAESFSKGMANAYGNNALKAIIFRIDSPGGSPVQADYMYNLIHTYRQKYPAIKTYAVCIDTCASAAYYVASAADEIYANPSSLVGSIGVMYSGFGFVDTLNKLGVARRLQTAGRNKGFMDPFSPVDSNQEKNLQTMLDLIHQEFIDKVKAGRGNRLKIDDETFSGLIWTGLQAKERGLIDGFASSDQLAHERIKIDQLIDYTDKRSVFEQVAKNVGTAMANQLPLALGMEQRIG